MEQLQVLSRPRPVRIAFFVALDQHANAALDAIFRCAFSLWGGRFSMVVPCADGAPLPSYLPWLRAFDPDLIYSYVEMSNDEQARIHEELYPFDLIYHAIADEAWLRPELPFQPLGAVTALPLASLPHRFDGGRGTRVIHALGATANYRFVINNCGTDFHVLNALRSGFAPYGEPLILVEPEEQLRLKGHIRSGEATIPDVPSLLQYMATHPRDRSQADLSSIAAARLSLEDPNWGKSFNLIVGDTPADRIVYWNSRVYVPTWRDGDAVDLCVSPDDLGKEAFLGALADFLIRRNHVNESQGNAPPRVTLRSISLPVEQLALFVERLKERVKGQIFDCAKVTSLEHCIPTAEALTRGKLVAAGSFYAGEQWKESYVAGTSFNITPPQPDHLRALSRGLLSPETGAWATDLDIERPVNHSPFDNVRHRWRLPRRLRVTTAFCRDYQVTSPHGRQVSSRTSKEGFLTAFSAGDQPLPTIMLPTDEEAIRTALQRGRNWRPIREQENAERCQPEQLCYAAERSDAGQHFYGAYQMFGSLSMARSMLLHQFWRKQFNVLGATERRTVERHQRVIQQIKRRLRGNTLDLSQDSQREVLANLVLLEADAERMTTPNLKWSDLADDFNEMVDHYKQTWPMQGLGTREEDDERRHLQAALRNYVQRACDLGILHQGYEMKCPQCLHRNWVALGDLKTKVHCQVCHHPNIAPVDQPWQFRINGFLREALQRYGVGPLIWVLARYQRTLGCTSFWFEGPLNIYFNPDDYHRRHPTGDIDLTIVLDGKVTMCEAKASVRSFDKPKKTAELFAKLRPDVALVAVMEGPSAALQARFEEFSTVLAGTGIEPRLWTLDEATDFEDSPWF